MKLTFMWHTNRRACYRKIASATTQQIPDDVFSTAMTYYMEQNTSRNTNGFKVDEILDELVEVLPFSGKVFGVGKEFWFFSPEDVTSYLSRAKQGTAPGWDGIPNQVWKHLPSLHPTMATIFEVCRCNN